MTATNHALTGAIIGLTVQSMWLVLPVALLSHFICDAIPHYSDHRIRVGSRQFKHYLVVDALGATTVAMYLFALRPEAWFVACWAAFFATSPDLMWAQSFFRSQKQDKDAPMPSHALARFHHRIQWFAKPIGAAVEYVWAIGAVLLLVKLTVI